MARFEFEYTEIDGKAEIDNLGKYGRLRLNYLYEQKPGMYRELLLTGKLAEHCAKIEKTAFEMAEHIREDYLRAHPMPEDDTLERLRISTQAQMIADEIAVDQ